MKNINTSDGNVFFASNEIINDNQKAHSHEHIELFRVTHGFIRLYLNSTLSTYDVFPGDVAIIGVSDSHAIYPHRGTEIFSANIPLSYITSLGSSFLRSSFIIPGSVIEENTSLNSLINNIFNVLSEQSHSEAELSVSLIKSLCTSLCSILFHHYGKRRTVSTVPEIYFKIKNKAITTGETLENFNKVKDFLDNNYTNKDINLTTLSKISGLNKNFLSSLFPRITRKHYTEYIHELRINRAIELMYRSDKNLSEIAFLCGFETTQSFYNAFKKLCSTTPSKFLSQIKAETGELKEAVIDGRGKKLFNYSWYTNIDGVSIEKDIEKATIKVSCTNRYSQLWCHLLLKHSFTAGTTYRIRYKGKALENSAGTPSKNSLIYCCFTFKDNRTNNDYHIVQKDSAVFTDEGFTEFVGHYTVPEYYKPSLLDCFSIFSNPLEGLGVSYLIKDIYVEKA